MATRPTILDIRRLGQVCGFELGNHTRHPDRFGPLIQCISGTPEGFVTKVLGDSVRHYGSELVLSDGAVYSWRTSGYELNTPPFCTKKAARLLTLSHECVMDLKRRFVIEDATFAVTQVGVSLERVFLFYEKPDFDIERVIETIKLFCWQTDTGLEPSKRPACK